MPESSLSLSVDDLKAEIGQFLGYGRGDKFDERAWTTRQASVITSLLKSGLSQVYTPPVMPPSMVAHEWSFLSPHLTLTTVAKSSTVDLPDDFGGFTDGHMYVTGTSTRRPWKVPIANEGLVRQRHSTHPDTTGCPTIACEAIIKGTKQGSSTRSQILFWPKADAVYSLQFAYKYLPDVLTGGYPYPPGGATHAELFKASCVAAAEIHLDDVRGPRWQYFMERMAASVAADRKRKGHQLGYNGDSSDGRGYSRDGRFAGFPVVTVNGVAPN